MDVFKHTTLRRYLGKVALLSMDFGLFMMIMLFGRAFGEQGEGGSVWGHVVFIVLLCGFLALTYYVRKVFFATKPDASQEHQHHSEN